MAAINIAVLSTLLCVVTGNNFVNNVRQNYVDDINSKLVQQIQKELSASYIYQGYASYFQRADVSLPGIQKFFSGASVEERDHAQSLIDYINKRGGYATFNRTNLVETCAAVLAESQTEPNVLKGYEDRRMCICGFIGNTTINSDCEARRSWKEGMMAFGDALIIERYVNKELLDIHKAAEKNNDVHLAHILEHEFLEEQISSINKLAHYITRLQSFEAESYKLGEYMFDQRLA